MGAWGASGGGSIPPTPTKSSAIIQLMLDRKKRYLQVALNSNPFEARSIIASLPPSDRIILEAGTPLIKEYGIQVVREIKSLWSTKSDNPYVVADLKCMDRGEREVGIAAQAGASAAVVLGLAPVETINSFISFCKGFGIDSMVDMMNVDQPFKILRKLTKLPDVVILHRGVDEEQFSQKPLPIHLINKVKGSSSVLIAMAGGDKPREIQSAVFNGADIVVVWKDFYESSSNASEIAANFLQNIK